MPLFGDDVDPYKHLQELKDEIDDIELDGERVDYITYQIMRRRSFERAFNIMQFDDPRIAPLESVSVKPKENFHTQGSLEHKIWRYKTYDIGTLFKLSLDEFLAQPRHVNEYLLSLAVEDMEKNAPTARKTLEELSKKAPK